jgi:hypothetical protein
MNDDAGIDGRDPFDDELRRRFGASGPAADPDAVLDLLRPRLERARARRRASIAGALGGVAVVVVVLLVVLGGGRGTGNGSVRTPPASRGPVSSVSPAPTTTEAGGSATAATRPDDHANDTTADDHGNDAGAALPGATESTAPPVTESAAAPSQTSFTSDGGSIVVTVTNGRVSLASSSPAPGYGVEVHDNGPTRVEVRFDNGQTEWRVRVDVVDDRLVPEITQH